MSVSRPLTTTEILAAATEQFATAGYRRIDPSGENWDLSNSRLFEDRFGLVGLVVFETWAQLVEGWPEAQGLLVDVISRHASRSNPKAWEGYLVLLTPGVRGQAGKEDWTSIRYNTRRIRKFVASGEELRSIGDVRATIAPLLPFETHAGTATLDESVLDMIPDLLLETHGIPRELSRRMVRAFDGRRNLMQEIHEARGEGT